MEKQALDVSNNTGFDYIEEQKNDKEIMTEVFDLHFDIKTEPIDENIDEEIEKQALDVGLDHENSHD